MNIKENSVGRKILVGFDYPKIEEFQWGEKTIRVKPYIKLDIEQPLLYSICVDAFLGNLDGGTMFGIQTNFYHADVLFDTVIIEEMTNIKIDSDKIKMDDVYASGLMDEIRKRIDEIPCNKTIAIHCAGGYRSYLAQRILMNRGYNDVINIMGGYALIRQVQASRNL